MPSVEHEAHLELFRACPELVVTLLRDRLGVALPQGAIVRVASGEFTELPQYRPDLAVIIQPQAGAVRMVVVVELQRAVDVDKPFVWPLYAAALRARHRAPTAVMVVAPRAKVARWARRPILDLQPGCTFRPLVVGPDEIPVVVATEAAKAAPELAVLSAMAHWREFPETLAPVVAALAAADELPRAEGELYCHLTLAVLSPAARGTLRKIMATHTPFISKFGKELIEEGRLEGRKEGRQEGRQEGRKETLKETLLKLLDLRRIAVTEAQRAAVRDCTDESLLDSWIARAAIATTPEGVFETRD